jgi:Fe(3+) dicitrate transport protein
MTRYSRSTLIQLQTLSISLLCSASLAVAQNTTSATGDQASKEAKIIERITVSGTKDKADSLPGSAYLMDKEELNTAKGGFDDIGQVLRQIPGVNVQDEEGFGLRPNIGFRGVPVERSEGITLMEDGVLAAPAPYSAPAAYYFPTVGRMEQLEVTKGAGQIKYGPRTLGGALNLLSTSIPQEKKFFLDTAAGMHDTQKVHLYGGGSGTYGGVLLETYQLQSEGFKKLDGGGDTGFDLQDYIAKFRVNTAPEAEVYQSLELKLGYYEQDSNETYLGLTDSDFRDSPTRRYAASELDKLTVQHEIYQLRHFVEFGDGIDLTTTGYVNRTARAWYKLQSVGGKAPAAVLDAPDSFSSELGWLRGEESPLDALAIRDNNREYLAQGVQTVFAAKATTGDLKHEVELGARYHEDEEDRFQRDDLYQMDNRSLVLTTTGNPGSESNRISSADAWAFHALDKISYGKFALTPGLRYERISLTREDYGKADPLRTGAALKYQENTYDVLIPGVGALYDFSNGITSFVGVHKGFAPPGPSNDPQIKEEKSIAYELGTSYKRKSLWAETTLFLNDYDNLLGADSAASGGEGTGDLFNGGKASVWGVESALQYDMSEPFAVQSITLPLKLSYTYTNAEFDSSFQSELFGSVQSGNSIPYIAQNQGFASFGIAHERYGSCALNATYVDAMPTLAGTSTGPSAPYTDSFVVFGLDASTPISKDASLYVDIMNLLDESYAVARRPAGARPGLPFTTMVGVRVSL